MEYDPRGIDTVGQLMDALQDYDPDTPVRWAAQPAWPFEYTIGQVVRTPDDAETTDAETDDAETTEGPVVWLGEGAQLGYLPGTARGALGWSW